MATLKSTDDTRLRYTLQLKEDVSAALNGRPDANKYKDTTIKLLNKYKRKWKKKRNGLVASVSHAIYPPFPSDILQSLNEEYETSVESLVNTRREITQECQERLHGELSQELQQFKPLLDRQRQYCNVQEPINFNSDSESIVDKKTYEQSQRIQKISSGFAKNCATYRKLLNIKTLRQHKKAPLLNDHKHARLILMEIKQGFNKYRK